ncbi:hypothetical protein SISSUDRAFT_1031224 [Sistotremastrum suecicum HHB10207 ss-3]|uniref:Uncharacterized protein n=1 Tax=Sistotremastrum suecicum HHB10207 ss-3 TaxID=1314776 RepID=A0A166GC44_9AGAM|nr:hypothetical protein SISSUDRAFT_1031224 [Sistotremastrum suecicum HHB10207 ss-3]
MSRIEAWGRSAGMETFKETQPASDHDQFTIVLGGKVLVLDIELAVYNHPDDPKVKLLNVKTSNEVASADSTTKSKSPFTLDALLASSLRSFMEEVQKGPMEQDCMKAARLGSRFKQHLDDLVGIDQLDIQEKETPRSPVVKWFEIISDMGAAAEDLAKEEWKLMNSDLTFELPSLDIFLQRSHGLPLTYVHSCAVTFLTYLSPIAYLTFLRTPPQDPPSSPILEDLEFDIPMAHLRDEIRRLEPTHRVVMADLRLSSAYSMLPTDIFHQDISLVPGSSRPTLSASFTDPGMNFPLPQATLAFSSTDPANSSTDRPLVWVLEFSGPGIVMTQTRMKEIYSIIDAREAPMNPDIIGFGTGSGWIDLLFNPTSPSVHEKYTTIIKSPSSAHPPIHVMVESPEEPGFILGAVPVRTLRQVWAVLEVVKEQCWINGFLQEYSWQPEISTWHEPYRTEPEPVLGSAEELAALLNGTLQPQRLEVSAFLHSNTHEGQGGPKVIMSVPTKSYRSMIIELAYDPSSPRGIRVTADGINVELLEEVARRGGAFALCGRAWQLSE